MAATEMALEFSKEHDWYYLHIRGASGIENVKNTLKAIGSKQGVVFPAEQLAKLSNKVSGNWRLPVDASQFEELKKTIPAVSSDEKSHEIVQDALDNPDKYLAAHELVHNGTMTALLGRTGCS